MLQHCAIVVALLCLLAGGSGLKTDTNPSYSQNGARSNDGGQLVHHVRARAAQ
jgi:hypothetical protein